MPVVKSETISIPVPEEDRSFSNFVMKVKFSGKWEKFTIDLPEIIALYLDVKTVQGDTIDEARKAFFECLDKYKTSILKKKKIIWYEVQTCARIYKGEGNEKSLIYHSEDISFCHGTGIIIEYKVLFEHCLDLCYDRPHQKDFLFLPLHYT